MISESYTPPKAEFSLFINCTNMQTSYVHFCEQHCYNMHCIFKTENEAGILGEPESDSASVKDLLHCPEDMTVIYTDMGVMTVIHIPQTLLRQSVLHLYWPHPPRGGL